VTLTSTQASFPSCLRICKIHHASLGCLTSYILLPCDRLLETIPSEPTADLSIITLNFDPKILLSSSPHQIISTHTHLCLSLGFHPQDESHPLDFRTWTELCLRRCFSALGISSPGFPGQRRDRNVVVSSQRVLACAPRLFGWGPS